jgi:hypothetical protein
MSVGSWVDQMGEVVSTLAESWNGSSWSKVATPSPDYTTPLDGIACTSSSDCMAVGSKQPESGNQVTLAESWNGTKWALVNTPNP